MVKAKIAINGYGTIGKRVADAVRAQNDMEVIGISKTKPNYETALLVMEFFLLRACLKIQSISTIGSVGCF